VAVLPLGERILDQFPFQVGFSWRKTESGIYRLAELIRTDRAHTLPVCVVGIHVIGFGGGAVVADMVARLLGVPLYLFTIRYGQTDGVRLPLTQHLHLPEEIETGQILIIDDVTFTGNTLIYCHQEIRKSRPGAEIKVGTLISPKTKSFPIVVNYSVYVTLRSEVRLPWGPQQRTPGRI
jgi:hypoxanthine phosphoribosyltransferase